MNALVIGEMFWFGSSHIVGNGIGGLVRMQSNLTLVVAMANYFLSPPASFFDQLKDDFAKSIVISH